jgi:hypothetical protein
MSTAGLGHGVLVFATPLGPQNTSIPPTTMVSAPASGSVYRFGYEIKATDGGMGCMMTGTVTVQLSYTDSDNTSLMITSNTAMIATGTTLVTASLALPTTAVGVGAGNIAHAVPDTFAPASSASITYSTTYTAGSGCMAGQKYIIRPWLEEIK